MWARLVYLVDKINQKAFFARRGIRFNFGETKIGILIPSGTPPAQMQGSLVVDERLENYDTRILNDPEIIQKMFKKYVKKSPQHEPHMVLT